MSGSVSGRKKSDDVKVKGTIRSDISVRTNTVDAAASAKSCKESSIYEGSEEYFQYSCDPCSTAGDHLEAQGFCVDCEEYLCVSCYKSHPRNKASRHHVLLDKDSMPKESVKYCDPCKLSGDEAEATGYCINCEDYLCSACFKSHSRNKASRQHVLLDKDNMPPKSPGRGIVSSIEKVNISKVDTGNQDFKEKYSYIRKFNVKAAGDKNDCTITGMVLVANGELVMVDERNKELKLVDIENDIIKDELELASNPHGIAPISQHQIAVALGNENKIHIISTSLCLSIIRTFRTNGACMDIKCINRKLYVSYCKPVKLQIIELTGEVYKTIQPGSDVLKHCTLPRYIAVSRDENSIYMSDWETSKVIRIDMKGNIISINSGELVLPQDIAISPFKSLYLCNMMKHIVCKLTQDLGDATTILDPDDGLKGPRAICFNDARRHLYISSGSEEPIWANFIKVYQWN